MVNSLIEKYDSAAVNYYEERYVHGGWELNHYMKDEADAFKFWQKHGELGKIISLGVGSGQDIEILNNPAPETFVGYDFSKGMLENARKKFPEYTFHLKDCKERIDDSCDILVSMFGTPNYIGLSTLLEHYRRMKAKHAFFVFYAEWYDDGFGEYYHKYTLKELKNVLQSFKPIIEKLNNNYYIVKW